MQKERKKNKPSSNNYFELNSLRNNFLIESNEDDSIFDFDFKTFRKEICSKSSDQQLTAILVLQNSISSNENINFKTFPTYFFDEIVNVFSNEYTERHIKLAIIKLIELICTKYNKAIYLFAEHLLYINLFFEFKKQRNEIDTESIVSLLNLFIQNSSVAFNFLLSNEYLDLLIEMVEKAKNNNKLKRILVCSLNYVISSIYLITRNHTDSLLKITKICMNFLNQDVFINDKEIFISSIQILSSIIIKCDKMMLCSQMIIQSNISTLLLSLISLNYIEVSSIIIEFLSNATFASDEICEQLTKTDYINILSKFLKNDDAFHKYGKLSFRIIFNVFVFLDESGFDTSFLDSDDYNDFNFILSHSLQSCTIMIINQVMILLDLIIHNLPKERAIKYFLKVQFPESIHLILETGQERCTYHLLAMLEILFSSFSFTESKILEEFKKKFFTEEFQSSLFNFIETCDDDEYKIKAVSVYNIINEIKLSGK